MRRARSPMVMQRPLTLCSIALLVVILACSPHSSLAETPQAEHAHKEAEFQAAKTIVAAVSAPAPAIELVATAPAPAEDLAVADAPAPSGVPELPAVSFLGLPAIPLPYKDYSAEAPAPEFSPAQAPAPAHETGADVVKAFVGHYIEQALPPAARPLAGAVISGAPLPSASQVLQTITQAIPAEAPPPAAAIRVKSAQGKVLESVNFPTVDNIFSALSSLGRRRLLADGAPALAPGPEPGSIFPQLTNLEVGGNDANPNADTSFAESQWYKTDSDNGPQLQAQPQPNPQPQPSAQLQAQPLPQPQPLQNLQIQTQETEIGGLPAQVAPAPIGAQPGQPQPQPAAQLQAQPQPQPQPQPSAQLQAQPQPQPAPLAPRAAPSLASLIAPGPDAAPAPKVFGPIPSEVKVFTERLVNFLGAEARSQLPKRVEVNAAGRRRLAQEGPLDRPAESFAADAPVVAPGGLPGPQFQALPEPAPLPPLPRPAEQLQAARPEEASSMAPMAAPGGEASARYQARPEASHHHLHYAGPARRLQQGPPGTVPEGVDATQPDAATAPVSAPGGLPGPTFEALPEPAPLPPLPRPAPQLQTRPAESMAPESAPGGEAQPGAQYQARSDAPHHRMNYMGTTGRRLLQGPPGTVPEDIAATQPDAAMTPDSAPGALPQPGPVFQALPEPAPLPPLPRPAPQLQTRPAESMAPESAPGGEAQPGAQYQARPEASHHRMNYMGTTGRRLQQGPPGTVPEDVETTQPDAAMTPMSAPGALPQPGPVFQALPEPAPLPPLPRPAQQLQTRPAESMAPESAPGGEAQPGAQYQARPAASHHREAYYMGTTGRRMLQEDGPPGTVPEHVDISDTESDAAMTPMSAMMAMPQPGPQLQAMPMQMPMPMPASQLQEHPMEAPEAAPAGVAQPGAILEANFQAKNPKGANHVNPAAHVTTASGMATTVPAAPAVTATNGRKLQAMAPAPAPEEGPSARRDMPPLPPIGPGNPAPGAQPPQPGAQGPAQEPPRGVGVFQASDPNNQEAPALQIPKSYETGIINAFKQAIPEYISNALAAGR